MCFAGNTCYLSSVLQVLRFTPGFRTDLADLSAIVKGTMRELRSKNGEVCAGPVTKSVSFPCGEGPFSRCWMESCVND